MNLFPTVQIYFQTCQSLTAPDISSSWEDLRVTHVVCVRVRVCPCVCTPAGVFSYKFVDNSDFRD